MFDKIRTYVLVNKKELFFVLLIFLLAFAIRGHLMIYELMFEFDTYFHARLGEYVAQTLIIPTVDPLAYFQVEGGATLSATGGFFWFFTAILFKIFTLNAPFSKDAWIVAVKLFPAIFGALTCVAMYYLGKQMYGPKAGVTMAFFAAVIPAFVYRTMAGQFEEDSLGFLWMVVGVIFFIRAVQKAEFNNDTVKNSVIAAFFFSLMAWTWQMFIMIPIILVAWLPSTFLIMWLRKESKEKFVNLAKNFAITFVLFTIVSSALVGTAWIDTATGYVATYIPVTGENLERISTPGGVATSVYSVSVGEEQQGFRFWGNKYSALIFFPVIALLVIIPYRLLRKKNDYITLIAFYWILVAMFMAYVRLKFTYVFGLPIAIAAGITLHELFKWSGDRPGFEKKTVAFALGFMFLVGAAAGTFFVAQNIPTIEQDSGWKEALTWIREETPKDSTFFNWWDEGHWVTFIGERSVSTDNRNYSFESNSDMAQFILAEDIDEAHRIVEKYNPTYVLLSEDLIGKMGSLGLYAYNTVNFQDPRVTKYFAVALPCTQNKDALSGETKVLCGGNALTPAQYMSFPTKRLEEPNQTLQGTTKVFIYRNEAGTGMFIFNRAANNTMIVRLFFDLENTPGFEEAYSGKEVRIFKPTFLG